MDGDTIGLIIGGAILILGIGAVYWIVEGVKRREAKWPAITPDPDAAERETRSTRWMLDTKERECEFLRGRVTELEAMLNAHLTSVLNPTIPLDSNIGVDGPPPDHLDEVNTIDGNPDEVDWTDTVYQDGQLIGPAGVPDVPEGLRGEFDAG